MILVPSISYSAILIQHFRPTSRIQPALHLLLQHCAPSFSKPGQLTRIWLTYLIRCWTEFHIWFQIMSLQQFHYNQSSDCRWSQLNHFILKLIIDTSYMFNMSLPYPRPLVYPFPLSRQDPPHILLAFMCTAWKQPAIATEYRKSWAQIRGPIHRLQEFWKLDIDMLDSILLSAVQAIAESVLGLYHPGKSRMKPDKTGAAISYTAGYAS